MKQIEEKITALLEKMTLEEKISCCHAAAKFSTSGIERLGIPPLSMSDGPHGVREEICADSWDAVGGDNDFATYLPTGTALAATWSEECARLFGEVLGSEARERGKDVILGPGVNIVRSPLCGRNFEYYGEDPYQVGVLAAESIQGIQSQGTAACVKHFALNSQELNRMGVDARCEERTLREIYLPAFEAAVKQGKVMTVMGAYNKFNGQHCCQNDYLLNRILKKEWEFDGLVISDWAGVSDTYEAARNGMDLEMGTGLAYADYFLAEPFRRAVENGEINPAVLDEKVRRYLRLMFRLGLLGGKPRPDGERNSKTHQAAARRIASEAMVLLKNCGGVLPLNPKNLKKILVVGENAIRKHHRGGHSSAVKALYEVTPLEGIERALKDSGVEIQFFKGYPSGKVGEPIPSSLMGFADEGAGTRGWICRIRPDRNPEAGEFRFPMEQPAFELVGDLKKRLEGKDFNGEISGTFTPDKSGKWTFFLEGGSQSGLVSSNGNWIENCKSADNITGTVTVELEAGRPYFLRMPLYWHSDMPLYPIRLTALYGEPKADDDAELDAAAECADAVLFFGGLNHTYDCEGTDRKDMKLHNGQNERISRLAKCNPRTVVVLVGGSPMELPWADEVPAILQMWYAGCEAGNAVADVLFGKVNPSGKLPFTFPESYAASPVGANGDYAADVCNYREGVFVGYRWFDANRVKPLFPFGFGLSYTNFEFSGLRRENAPAGKKAAFRVEVRNTGTMAGAETVQLYVEPAPVPGVPRPVRELKAFRKVFLQPGESRRILLELDERAFEYFHPVRREWTLEAGTYGICVGDSSVHLPLKTTVTY